MPNYRMKPTKPAAIFTAVVGVAIVVFGIVNVGNKPNGHGFIWLWAVIGLGIVGFGLWSAFSPRGGTQIISTDADQPPHRPGTTTNQE
jgi:threonine dehydrogenase-like Zn-dependent dehydrogenase